jgi:16S rRNA G966 N2-methylase RsmD
MKTSDNIQMIKMHADLSKIKAYYDNNFKSTGNEKILLWNISQPELLYYITTLNSEAEYVVYDSLINGEFEAKFIFKNTKYEYVDNKMSIDRFFTTYNRFDWIIADPSFDKEYVKNELKMLKKTLKAKSHIIYKHFVWYRRETSRFDKLNIKKGSKLYWWEDLNIQCEVISKTNKVKYNDKIFTVSGLCKYLCEQENLKGYFRPPNSKYVFPGTEGSSTWSNFRLVGDDRNLNQIRDNLEKQGKY